MLFSIIVVAEGATFKDEKAVVQKIVKDSPDPIRLGGIGNLLAARLEAKVKEHEVRNTVLGHLQRGGAPSTFDRILSTRYGVTAVNLLMDGRTGNMVALDGRHMTFVHLENVIGRNKQVNPTGELVETAKSVGISFGD